MRDFLEDLNDGDRDLSDPVQIARQAMRTKLPKRFYKLAQAVASADGFAIELDGRPVRTPARNVLVLPNLAAAELVAAEWQAQEVEIDPARMPATRIANTAIDGVAIDPQAVLEDIIRFSTSDLLCYRSASPVELVQRQAEVWDGILDWFRARTGTAFAVTVGITHQPQPRETVAAFGALLRRHDTPFALACLHVFTTLTGSAVLALAIAEGEIDAETAWDAAHVDEDWNIEHWGEDDLAAARRVARQIDMNAAAAMLAALRCS